MNDFKKAFRELSLRLELFTSIIPIPSYVYFVAIVGAFNKQEQFISVAISGLVAGGYTVFWGLFYRYRMMNSFFKEIKNLESSNSEDSESIKRLKVKILSYPFQEVKIIIFRWIVGCTSGILFYFFLEKGDIPIIGIRAIYMGLFFVLPISVVMYLFETELSMKKILDRSIFKNVDIGLKEIPYFGYFRRILTSIVAVAITPMTIMGYIIYSMVTGTLLVKDPVFHILLLAGQSLASMLIVSYSVARSVKYGLAKNNQNLEDLGNGIFDHFSTRSSCDEFGEQSALIGNISLKLKTMYEEIKELNLGLEKKVEIRTSELNQSLQEVQVLKEKQDGDYFLTNLILRPLFKNFNKSKFVKTDFFVRQHKQFLFKKKTGELGGDICITGNLLFYGRPFTMIVNADAMGKSMQGAGGSIVFGTVMNDIMARSASKRKNLNMDPKDWMKETYESLHGIFLSFDGSMLISCAMGLLDEYNGKFYHFNAEHPRIVLFRDGIAEFLHDNNSELRKLGSPIQVAFELEECQLEKGDILFFGSDGRDDLILGGEKPTMNEDENLFLKVVADSKGNLENIYENLITLGEIMDDISIIRVEFNLDSEETDLQVTTTKEILNLIRKSKYLDAMHLLDRMPPDEFPSLNYYRGYCLERLGRGREAISFLRKGVFHQSTEMQSLRLLAKIYYRAGEFKDALDCIEEASSLNPKNETIQKELEKIRTRALRDI
jgi:hypothetical protein